MKTQPHQFRIFQTHGKSSIVYASESKHADVRLLLDGDTTQDGPQRGPVRLGSEPTPIRASDHCNPVKELETMRLARSGLMIID